MTRWLWQPRLREIWLAGSALWVVGYLYGESLDGLMWRELGEVIPMTILPPLVPALVLGCAVRLMAGVCRP